MSEEFPEPVAPKFTDLTAILGDDLYPYRYPVPREYTYNIMATVDERWAVLESMGIPRRDDTTPLRAWRDAVADATGVRRSELDPEKGGSIDMGFSPAYVRRFVMFLA